MQVPTYSSHHRDHFLHILYFLQKKIGDSAHLTVFNFEPLFFFNGMPLQGSSVREHRLCVISQL